MYLLTMLVWVNGLLDNPSVITHEFKSKAACEAAAERLEKRLTDARDYQTSWQCDPK